MNMSERARAALLDRLARVELVPVRLGGICAGERRRC